MWVVSFAQNLWPFKFDDLKASDRLVKKLSVPESTKHFVYAVRVPESQAVIYILCVQNLSERSVFDVECLIKEVKPDAVISQVGPPDSFDELPGEGINSNVSRDCSVTDSVTGDEIAVPTSSLQVLWRCFLHKINREKYENVAGNVVLKEIFGVGFNSHFLAAKKAAEEVGSSFLLLETPSMKSSGEQGGSAVVTVESENSFGALSSQTSNLLPQDVSPKAASGWRAVWLADDLQSRMVKSLSSYVMNCFPVRRVKSEDISPRVDYDPPQFAQSFYPLLRDLHDIFVDIPSMGMALAHVQRMLYHINRGEVVDSQLLAEAYTFRIAVEGLRVALNNAGKLPLSQLGASDPAKTEFSELPVEDKSHALLAHALRSQSKKFKCIVAVVDASGLAGLRRNWKTFLPEKVMDMVEELVIDSLDEDEIQKNDDRKRLLTKKPVVAVGAGATAVLGASSLTKSLPASSFIKIVTLNVPTSLKLMLSQTQRAVSILLGKSSLGASKVIFPGMAKSSAQSSIVKAAASAEKIRTVTHGIIASAEKTSLSAMRTAFYEIMRNRRVRRPGLLPWATFGCSMATCASLLIYGDGIECAAESLPTAPSIANLGRGIQSLHQASEAVKHSERSRIQKSIESLLYRFKKV